MNDVPPCGAHFICRRALDLQLREGLGATGFGLGETGAQVRLYIGRWDLPRSLRRFGGVTPGGLRDRHFGSPAGVKSTCDAREQPAERHGEAQCRGDDECQVIAVQTAPPVR